MKLWKRCLAVMLSFVMAAAMLPLSSAEMAKAAEPGSLLAEYKFEDGDIADKTITDASGNGYDASLEGTGAAIANGVLTLPGGAAGSSAAYVSIPGRLFENRDTLTISAWLKNDTGKGDYSAMYFGTTTKHLGGGTSDMPLHYWILNPMNPSEYFKSVWTNGDNASTPYSTETPVSSTKTSADWGLYTTVITPDRIIGYYNGVEVCNNSKSKTTTDFGTGLVACIGRSAYNDKFYKGGVYGVRVYGQALTQTEIWQEYYEDMPPSLDKNAIINGAITEVKESLVLDSTVTKNLSLPTEGAKGAVISWESTNPNVISTDGKVTIPTDADAGVTLTATISVGGKTDTKTFDLTVPAVSMQEQFNNWVKDFSIGTFFVSADLELPATLGANTSISWTSSNVNAMEIVAENGKIVGKVKRSGQNADVRLTLAANVTYQNGGDNFSAQKSFDVVVRGEADYAYLMSYTNTKENASLGNSLHLAYSVDGTEYTALNSNTGICFANNWGGGKASNPNGLQGMYIFRKADGTYGMVARNTSVQKYIYVFDSVDLINFTNERKLELGYDVSGDLQVSPVSEQGAVSYQIFWKSGNKKFRAVTADFATATDVQETDYEKESLADGCKLPEGASVGNVLRIGKSEYDRVVGKLDVVRNTGVQSPQIEVKLGETANVASLLPETVKTDYSDGSVKDMKVVWNQQDIAGTDLSKVGTYQVKGTVQQTQYANPFIQQRADPCILKGNDGYYYFTASYPMCGGSDKNGYDKIVLRQSETIEGLAEAEEITIWDCDDDSSNEYRYIWAPEIRLVDGQYYVFYTSSIESSSPWGIRPHVLKCMDADDIMNPASWQAMGLMQANSGDAQAFTAFSLDMTVFENQGRWYVIWPQSNDYSSLFIAEINKEEPWKCISDSVKISIPEYSWERQVENVNEGPSVIKNNGKIYVAFSAAGTGPEYCVGLLSIDEDADMLDAASWKKQGYPVLTSADVPGEYGPGHNSFTVDEDGNDIFVYHARGQQCYDKQCQWASAGSLYDPCRDARLKRVHWAADGTPILKMSYAEELAEENKTVTATINVRIPVSGVTLNKTSLNLTIGGSETLTATVLPTNASDKTVTWQSANPGIATVANGKVTAVAAGTTTITVTAADGKTANCTVTVKAADTNTDTVRVNGITLNKKKLTLGAGEKFTLKATVKPNNATNKTVQWTTSNKKAATVNKGKVVTNGKIKKATKVTITATADGKKATCTITVKAAPKKVTLNAKKKTLKKGKTFQIKAKLPKNTASNTIKYKSSNKKVATVSTKGKVKAVKKGKATITVTTFNKKSAKIKITVK